jgi:hypothetical protein
MTMTHEAIVILSEAKDPYSLHHAGRPIPARTLRSGGIPRPYISHRSYLTVEGRGFSRATMIPRNRGFSPRGRAI